MYVCMYVCVYFWCSTIKFRHLFLRPSTRLKVLYFRPLPISDDIVTKCFVVIVTVTHQKDGERVQFSWKR